MKTIKKTNEDPLYLTVKECSDICRFKGPETIRRAVFKGELPGVRIRTNRILIPAKDFWEWFHARDVVPKQYEREVELPSDVSFVGGTEKRSPHFRVKPKREAVA